MWLTECCNCAAAAQKIADNAAQKIADNAAANDIAVVDVEQADDVTNDAAAGTKVTVGTKIAVAAATKKTDPCVLRAAVAKKTEECRRYSRWEVGGGEEESSKENDRVGKVQSIVST